MPYAEPKVRASSWKAEDYRTRLAELRSEFAELSEKDRESDDYRKGKQSLFREREELDFEYRVVRAQSGELLPAEREMASRNGGVALLGQDLLSTRSAGELVIADEAFRAWMASPRGAPPVVELSRGISNEIGR